jgi:hypothetical protein
MSNLLPLLHIVESPDTYISWYLYSPLFVGNLYSEYIGILAHHCVPPCLKPPLKDAYQPLQPTFVTHLACLTPDRLHGWTLFVVPSSGPEVFSGVEHDGAMEAHGVV